MNALGDANALQTAPGVLKNFPNGLGWHHIA